MSIPHRSYHHIVNSNVNSFIKKFSAEEEMYVEEKIDGSNFYFATDGKNAVCGRRHAVLGDDEIFYNFQKIMHLRENMIKLYNSLIKNDSDKRILLYLYGELIPTQIRIKYVADDSVFFIAFDLKYLELDSENNDIVSKLLDRSEWEQLAKDCGFIVNPVLFRGSLDQCKQYDVENTKSIIPKLLDNNSDMESPIEGVVIKGNFSIKKKAHAFREVEKHGKYKLGQVADPNETAVGELISSMLTISRLENIVSQIGDKMVPDPHRLSNSVVLDAIAEARDDEDSVIFKITKTKVSKIQKQLAAMFTDTVKEHMKWN